MSAGPHRIVPAGRVLKRRDARAWITGLDDLRAAQRRAERRRLAAERGLRMARAAAQREGLRMAQAELDETVGRLLARAEADRAEVRRVVPDLVVALLDQVVGRLDADAVLADAVGGVLADATDALAVLRVPEDRLEAMQAFANTLADGGTALAVEVDPRLDADQALLVLGDAIVDVGVQTRLDAVAAAFEREWAGAS